MDLLEMWRKRRYGKTDTQSEGQTEDAGDQGTSEGDSIKYVVTLLEYIAYQTYDGPMEPEAYFKKLWDDLRKDSNAGK